MNRILVLMLGSVLLLVGIFWSLSDRGASSGSGRPVMFYCAASNRAVMEQVLADYQKETGRAVQIQYGPSQTLLSTIEVTRRGDLFLPADDSYLKIGQEKGLVAETLPIATMSAVIVVPSGNPKGIQSLEDLLRDDVRLVMADPESAAVGKVTRRVLRASGRWDDLASVTKAMRATVTEVANDITIGAADAGIVYDAVLHTYPQLESIEVAELAGATSRVSVGVIESTKHSADALHFARYVSASDRGLVDYREHGFQVVEGDRWDDRPELTIFAGSMLRPAILETIVRFEKREGVGVNRTFNGCGILVAQMKAGQKPDAYFACDTEFMNQVHDLFPEPVPVSENELVILVQKGNPKEILSLRDLARDGIRVGIGHEKQCAMGWITQNTFREGGIQEEVMPNVTVQTPTGDMLVNQLRAKSLDAAVVYLSNAAGASDYLDAVRIQGLDCSVASQPWAVAAESPYPNLASRLFQQICSAESQEIFASEGFRWQIEEAVSEPVASEPVASEPVASEPVASEPVQPADD